MTWRKHDIPDMSSKVTIVTGANVGLGFESAKALAEKAAAVIIAVRTPQKGEQAAAEIRAAAPQAAVHVMRLDLADLTSVREFAAAFDDKFDRLDVLLNNAGVMATPPSKTADGFELQFGTNHLGHFALTGLLLDKLLATAGARVVNVSSIAAEQGEMKFDDLNHEQEYSRWAVYQQSKLANLLFTLGLQARFEAIGADVLSAAAHPGVTATNLGSGIVGKNPILSPVLRLLGKLTAQPTLQGALPQLYAATAPDVQGRNYYGPDGRTRGEVKKIEMPPTVKTEDVDRLWDVSEKMTGVTMTVLQGASGD